jgi:hypothetical protein
MISVMHFPLKRLDLDFGEVGGGGGVWFRERLASELKSVAAVAGL